MKKLGLFLLAVLVFFTINTNVQAKESFYQADNNLSVGETFDSSVFFAGETVFSKSQVKGISFLAGNSVEVSGNTDYGVLAGNTVKITGTVNNDLFAAGSTISISSSAKVTRDSYLAAASVDINEATFGGDLRITAETVKLNNITISGNIYISATNIELGENVIIIGTLSYNENATIAGVQNNKIGHTKTYEEVTMQSETYMSKVKGMLFGIVSGFIVLVIMFLTFPKLFEKIDGKIKENKAGNYFSKIGIGFVGIFMIPIIAIVSICTVIGIPVGLVLLALYAVSLYFGTLITAYVLGNKVNTLMFKKEYNFYAAAFTGLIIIKLLGLIPIISGIVGLFSVLFGLGIIICLFSKNK